MNAHDAVLDILHKAYQIELDGYTFYSMTADKADKPAVRELFEKLASDESKHQAFLRSVLQNYGEQGAAAFEIRRRAPDMAAISKHLFSEKFRKQAEGAAFEMSVLSVGMTLENNAILYFTNAAAGATDAEARQFYEFLAGWEKQHLEALQGLFEIVRADHWAQGGFSPF